MNGSTDTLQGGAAALQARQISKAYFGTQALDDVSLEVLPGEVHALLGANGSGKSTLIKILAGVETADSGEFETAGRCFDAGSNTPAQSHEAGLTFVHQRDTTFPDLTVAENLSIGRGFERHRFGLVDWRALRRRAERVLQRFHIDAEPDMPLGSLSPASRTLVSIARALQDQEDSHRGVLFLDEPTASLPPHEVDLLLEKLRTYASHGLSIVYVSHRLEEVISVADRATVLRNGRVVAATPLADTDYDRLVELIAGQQVASESPPERGRAAGTLLSVKDLSGGAVRGVTFELGTGEVVGLAGLLGSGRSSLLKMLFGLAPPAAGEVSLGGDRYRPESAAEAMRSRVAYVPEERTAEAIFPGLSVGENLSAATLPRYTRAGFLRHRAEAADARAAIADFHISAPSIAGSIATLSGGNQQKVVLARWLRLDPRLLLLDEPSQGVDVGARHEIHKLVRDATASGASALVVSSDFEELTLLCDRVLVMANGQITAEATRAEMSSAEDLQRISYGRKATE